jgi:hypothetical protein
VASLTNLSTTQAVEINFDPNFSPPVSRATFDALAGSLGTGWPVGSIAVPPLGTIPACPQGILNDCTDRAFWGVA